LPFKTYCTPLHYSHIGREHFVFSTAADKVTPTGLQVYYEIYVLLIAGLYFRVLEA